jgi:inner membrane protein
MDPVTQAALGAVVGQAVGHRQLGYRAAGIGALAGVLPDADVLFTLGGDLFDEVVHHRGITHSLFFAPVVGPVLGYLVYRIERRQAGRRRTACAPPPLPGASETHARLGAWMLVVVLALLSHPLLDYVTSYGTQLLQPFSNARFAIDAMPIIDPLYTAILGLGLFAAARLWRQHAQRLAQATLVLSCAYIGYAVVLNTAAEREATRQLARAGIVDAHVAAFPTILQIHYRRVVARTPETDRVGFISLWRPCEIVWSDAPRDQDNWAVRQFLATREGRIFDWFTMGWARYRVDDHGSEPWVHATDLRYGFTDDPDLSIFNARAIVDLAERAIGPVVPGRDAADASAERLALLFRETYATICRG